MLLRGCVETGQQGSRRGLGRPLSWPKNKTEWPKPLHRMFGNSQKSSSFSSTNTSIYMSAVISPLCLKVHAHTQAFSFFLLYFVCFVDLCACVCNCLVFAYIAKQIVFRDAACNKMQHQWKLIFEFFTPDFFLSDALLRE